MNKVSIVVVGAGQRGGAYSDYISRHPDEAEIVAVCEPRDEARQWFSSLFSIPADRQFRSWEDIIDMPKLADAAFICTQDAQHKAPAIALADKGYHLLLEKPMAPTPEDCQAIYDAAIRNNIMLAVCHVLRYTQFNRKLKELLDRGIIGKVHSIQLIEQVGYWHQAHSYVRGNWRNEAESSSMLLAKSCHDIDLLNYLMPSKCTKVSSFGNRSYFSRENQPKGAADRCTDCPSTVESLCPYSALKIYMKDTRGFSDNLESLKAWPVAVVSTSGTREGVLDALRTGPYGRCVFACDNDVVDHQVVNMEFEGGATAGFTMCAFTAGCGREIYIMGDQGSLRCSEGDIQHLDFLTDKVTTVPFADSDGSITSGHGGGDYFIVKDFVAAVRDNDPSRITSGPDVSLESHLIVFAAERARHNATVEKINPASTGK